jgi:hypothetical protein
MVPGRSGRPQTAPPPDPRRHPDCAKPAAPRVPFVKRAREAEADQPRPTLHPDNRLALIGDIRIDKNEAVAPWADWERRLLEDPDAQLVL